MFVIHIYWVVSDIVLSTDKIWIRQIYALKALHPTSTNKRWRNVTVASNMRLYEQDGVHCIICIYYK